MLTRPPTIDDAEAVLAVLIARDLADLGVADYTLGDLLEEWRASDFDMSSDAIVIEEGPAQVLGYAIVRRPGSLVVVDPRHEGRGLGTQLLQWAKARERGLGRSVHRQWLGSGNERGRQLLQADGYHYERSYWRLVRPLSGVSEPHPVPPGVTLRALDVERDGRAIHALDAASFGGRPDYDPVSFETFEEEHLRAHDLDPELCRVAERAGEAVGFLLARRWEPDRAGYIAVLGVDPDSQGAGIGAALLEDAFLAFQRAGLQEAQLGVASDNPGALRLYERVGMTERFRTDIYERPVGPG